MAISNLVLTQQIYSEETNGAHAHYREPVPLTINLRLQRVFFFLTEALNRVSTLALRGLHVWYKLIIIIIIIIDSSISIVQLLLN